MAPRTFMEQTTQSWGWWSTTRGVSECWKVEWVGQTHLHRGYGLTNPETVACIEVDWQNYPVGFVLRVTISMYGLLVGTLCVRSTTVRYRELFDPRILLRKCVDLTCSRVILPQNDVLNARNNLLIPGALDPVQTPEKYRTDSSFLNLRLMNWTDARKNLTSTKTGCSRA